MFSEEIREDLHHCIKCGFCQAVCPTFRVEKLEYYAPRGRVQLVKHFMEGDQAATPEFLEAISSCILCDACAALCPSGIRIDRLFRNMRIELGKSLSPGLSKRVVFTALSRPGLLRFAARMAALGRRLLPALPGPGAKFGNIPLERMPTFNPKPFRDTLPEITKSSRPRRGRVLYFTGCATDLIHGDVGNAVIRVLDALGYDVVVPKDQVCCAAPMFLTGYHREALRNVEQNLDVLGHVQADAIVVDCATCGAALKKGIPELLEDLDLDPSKAHAVAERVRDISEIVVEGLDELDLEPPWGDEATDVTYHDPCHLVRGMGVSAQPRRILSALPGVRLLEMEGAGECCGGGGSFQFEHVELSGAITSEKTDRIRATGARVVATGCPGCRLTIFASLDRDSDPQVLHTIELLARSVRGELHSQSK